MNQGGILNNSQGFEAPTDSIEELGFNTDIDDEVLERRIEQAQKTHGM